MTAVEAMLTAAPTQAADSPAQVAGAPAAAPAAPAQKSEQTAPKGQEQPVALKGAEAAQPKSDAGKPQGAPDKYEFKAQPGQDFDSEVIKGYSEVARELNLSQEAAQKLIDKVAPVMHQRQLDRVNAARTEWAEQSKADKEFGGDQFDANLAVANKAMAKFGSPALLALLKESGLGNHPELIRAFFKAGKAISEDRIVPGGATVQGAQGSSFEDAAAKLYPNQK